MPAGGINKAKSRRSGHLKTYYERQKFTTAKNLLRKLIKHVEKHPRDERAKIQLKTDPPKAEISIKKPLVDVGKKK